MEKQLLRHASGPCVVVVTALELGQFARMAELAPFFVAKQVSNTVLDLL